MRLDANNPFHKDVAMFIDVLLDGEKVEKACIADTDFGEVHVYTGAVKNGEAEIDIKKGVVTLRGRTQFTQAWLLVNGY